jgi:hypothetical protein
MTRRGHAEVIINALSEYTVGMDVQYDERDIYPILDAITDEYAQKNLLQWMRLGDPNVPNQYTIEFEDVPVYYDQRRALCFSDLPANPIALPNGRGIDFVSPMRNMNKQVYVVNRNQIPLMAHDPNYGEGNVYGWQEGLKFFYTKRYDETNAPKMLFRIVSASASSVNNDAEYPIDPAMVNSVRNDVINYFLKTEQSKQDLTKDNRNDNGGK